MALNIFSSSLCFSVTWICGVSLLVAYLVRCMQQKKRVLTLPPGPKGLPVLGNFLMLRQNLPHRVLHRLSKQHGPIMYLRLGSIPTIVASSPQAAELFLKTHDVIFASRPFSEADKHISYDRKGLAFAEYGPYWQSIRKVCNVELLSNPKIEALKSMRSEEMELFIESLKEASRNGVEVDLSKMVKALSTDMSFRMVFGNKYIQSDGQGDYHTIAKEIDRLAGHFNIADYFPSLGRFDLQGLAKRMKKVSKALDDILEKIIDEHVNQEVAGGRTPDFLDFMLSYMDSKENEVQMDRSNIKAILLDILNGSMDTPAIAIDWTISELLKHPRVMKKVQQEIESFVGMDRMVAESDLVNLEYLDMVIKESFRLHPVVPLLMPHESTKDCTVNGYHIPQKSRIIINTWAIGRDPEVWKEADEFCPERFVGQNIDYIGRSFQFLPFGSGRRKCPGINLGMTVVRLAVAQLVHCFDWELSNGMLCSEINMDEESGMIMSRANHLSLIPVYRLRNEDPTPR